MTVREFLLSKLELIACLHISFILQFIYCIINLISSGQINLISEQPSVLILIAIIGFISSIFIYKRYLLPYLILFTAYWSIMILPGYRSNPAAMELPDMSLNLFHNIIYQSLGGYDKVFQEPISYICVACILIVNLLYYSLVRCIVNSIMRY